MGLNLLKSKYFAVNGKVVRISPFINMWLIVRISACLNAYACTDHYIHKISSYISNKYKPNVHKHTRVSDSDSEL